ncbi:MAG: FAD-binding oxidoreductase [Planctomycetota bacterium]
MSFARATPELVNALRAALGAEHVVTDRDKLEPLGRDETEDLHGWPDVAVFPSTTDEVATVLRLANEANVPIVPRAAGSGLSGGAVPVHGGIVLSVKRLDRILEIDEENLIATVEPGVITEVLQNQVEAKGLFYPPDPASKSWCNLGGNVAENAGGPRCVKYGVTRDYVLGLEVVLASGEVVKTGGKLRKDVTGYDLTRLLVGSEGTLAVITKIILELVPYPTERRTLMAPFSSVAKAAAAVAKVFQARVTPCACELLTRDAIAAAETRIGPGFPKEVSGAEACLLLEVDGFDSDALEKDFLKVGEACLAAGADDVLVAQSPERARELWRIRRTVGEAVKRLCKYRELDVAIPRTLVPRALEVVDEVLIPMKIRHISYGHAGDGNLHVNVLKDEMSDADWTEKLPRACAAIIERIVALGGTISGEHGIGLIQKDLMPLQLGAAELRLMRAIKQAFDPKGILNPGKLLPDDDGRFLAKDFTRRIC